MDERGGEVGRFSWYSRHAVLIAKIDLLVGGIATLVLGGIMSVGIVIDFTAFPLLQRAGSFGIEQADSAIPEASTSGR